MASYKEAIRRVYHDLVVRRSTVRVMAAEGATELTENPIFLTGVYRSGTTLVRYIVDSHSRIACPPESDFLGALAGVVEDPANLLGLERMGYDRDHVTMKLRDLAIYFFNNYAASAGKRRWADKTPAYVDYLDFIHQLFPTAQFVMIYRHGLDQAHSYTRGGTFMRQPLQGFCKPGEDMRVGAVRYWRDKVQGMLAFAAANPQQCLQMRYEDLCRQPEQHLRDMFTFLDEPWEPQVMEFYRFPHDKGAEDGRVAVTRGFEISENHYRAWPQDLRDQCEAIAADTMLRLGYEV